MKKILLFPIFLLLGILGCSKEKEVTIDYYNLIVNTRWMNITKDIHILLYFHSDNMLNIHRFDSTFNRIEYKWELSNSIVHIYSKDDILLYKLKISINNDILIIDDKIYDNIWMYPTEYKRSYLK